MADNLNWGGGGVEKEDSVLGKSYENMLMKAENARLLASMRHQPEHPLNVRHDSPEGGTDTVGFGYKLAPSEHASGYIDGLRISTMSSGDLMNMFRRTQKRMMVDMKKNLRSMGVDHAKWGQRQTEMAFDIHYNVKGGIKTFPKFTEAVDKKDWATALQESKRTYTDADTGIKHEMETRNDLFESQFFGVTEEQYGSAANDAEIKQTRDILDAKKMRDAAKGSNTPDKVAERLEDATDATMSTEEIDALEQQTIQEIKNSGVPAGNPTATAGNPAATAPAGVPLVPTPAPDIDLGGMLSKKYTAPTGEQGMLSTLPATLKG